MINEDVVIKFVCDYKGCSNDGIGYNTYLTDALELDSVELISLILAIEDNLNISFKEEDYDLANFVTPETIVNLIKKRVT